MNRYLNKFISIGLDHVSGEDNERLFELLSTVIALNDRPGNPPHTLENYSDEIKELISDRDDPVKPKTAYQIINERYGLNVSYSSFKRFIRKTGLIAEKIKSPYRIEMPPGKQTQLDYGLSGSIYDPVTKRNRRVWSFIGKLSCSRLPYIEFSYKQDQKSFSDSIINMGEFFGGFTETLAIDNLKAGVIKPDLYDPEINKSLLEVAGHYGFFVDPCRVRKSTDKGKVERAVPQARELFRKIKHLHPSATIEQANELAKAWCLNEYGMTDHGTTRQKPKEVFLKHEKPLLKPLPDDRYEVAVWKQAKVHIDRFIQFEKKCYCMPSEYIGKIVWVRKSEKRKIIGIYADSRLVREYTVSKTFRTYLDNDFPEQVREMLEGGAPKWILERARKLGGASEELIKEILKPHAYMNFRRAQSVLGVLEKHRQEKHFQTAVTEAIKYRAFTASKLQRLIGDAADQVHLDESPLMSSKFGKVMTRPADFYFK